MDNVSPAHRSWCDQDDCYTGQDGETVHLGPETVFDPDYGMVTVRLVERGDGIEVKLTLTTPLVTAGTTLIPETAAELGEALLDHAPRALGLAGMTAPGVPEWQADHLAVFREALEDVSVSEQERQALVGVRGLGEDVARHVAALITRARRNSSADR